MQMTKKSDKRRRTNADAERDATRELPLAPPAHEAPGEPPAAPPADADPLQRWREARELEEDMAALFDEDRVTHKHGDTEPESD
jgi:hypothetical protein